MAVGTGHGARVPLVAKGPCRCSCYSITASTSPRRTCGAPPAHCRDPAAVRQGKPWAVDRRRTVPLRELLCLLSLDTQRLAANARAPRRSMKRMMILLGTASTGERQPRMAEVQPAVVAGGAAHEVCFAAHSSDAVGQCKRLKGGA